MGSDRSAQTIRDARCVSGFLQQRCIWGSLDCGSESVSYGYHLHSYSCVGCT